MYPTQDIDDAKQLGSVLSRYKDRYYAEVLSGVALTYLFLQVKCNILYYIYIYIYIREIPIIP